MIRKIFVYLMALTLICLVCFRRLYRIFSWVLRICLFLLSLFVIVWITVGRALFLCPTNFVRGYGKRVRVAPKLYVIDSNNCQEKKCIILLQGKCPPLPSARKTSAHKWIDRMKQMVSAGYRVFLIEHRWKLFQSHISQRITDLNDVYNYLIETYPTNLFAIVGGSFGVTISLKWAAQQCYNRIKLPHLVSVIGLSPILSFSNAMARVTLPYFLIPDAMPTKSEMQLSSDGLIFGNYEDDPDFEQGDPFSDEDYLLFPLNVMAGRIPLMLIYCSDDPSADYQIWERWYDQHSFHKSISGVPAVQMIRLRNSRKYRGLQSHADSPLADKIDWMPRLDIMFKLRREYYKRKHNKHRMKLLSSD
jgi:hypothetical protein